MKILYTVFIFFSAVFLVDDLYSQSKPLLYFCERYDRVDGEIGQSSTFTPGKFTVMIKSDEPLGLTDVAIQIDSYDISGERFKFYNKVNFKIDPSYKYVFFANDDIRIDEPGVYRIYLLDGKGKSVAAGVVIIKSG